MTSRYEDLADLGEDDRIRRIGHAVCEHGKTVSFVVDDEPGKADRYVAKLHEFFPLRIRVVDRGKGPVGNTEWVKVGPVKGAPS